MHAQKVFMTDVQSRSYGGGLGLTGSFSPNYDKQIWSVYSL